MNRLKVWVFTLLAIAVAGVLLRAHSESLRTDALARIDGRLAQGAGQGEAALRATVRDASALASLVARDPALVRSLSPAPEPIPGRRLRAAPPAPDAAASDAAVEQASAAALAAAASALGITLPPGAVAIAGDRASLERRAASGPLQEPAARVKATLEGGARAGFVRASSAVAAAGAAPIGDGAAVAVLLPLREPFVRALAGATGLDVTLSAPETKFLTTGRPTEIPPLVEAARRAPGTVVGLGTLGPVDASIPPIPLRGLPPLFAAPAQRARAVLLEGVAGGALVVAAPVAATLAPVAVFEWRALAFLAALLLLGLLFGFLVRPSEILPAVPEELVAAAARIERGEFDARAPQLAGKLGTIAGALNRAASAAVAAAVAPARAAAPDPFAAPVPEAEPSAFDFPSRRVRAAVAAPAEPEPEAEPAPAAPSSGPLDGAALVGRPFEAAPVPARAEPEPAAPPLATAPDLLQEAARAAAPDAAPDEESHWRQVFDDFVRMRAECGEPAQGLPYERFRQKLQANKASLVAKYGCRTVRFQVYVKEGKTALKATPVR